MISDKGSHTNSKPKRNSQTDTGTQPIETNPSQSLSQKYNAGDFFDSSDGENYNSDSGSDFYLPRKSKKKHKIQFNDIKGTMTIISDAISGFGLDRKYLENFFKSSP